VNFVSEQACTSRKSLRRQSTTSLTNIIEHLKLGPVPRRVEVCLSLQMSKLDFIRSHRADDADREFHLQELVAFMPVNLQQNTLLVPQKPDMHYYNQKTFPVLCKTYCWTGNHFVPKLSAIHQPTRLTQPFILLGLTNEH